MKDKLPIDFCDQANILVSDTGKFICSTDWDKTQLGPIRSWPSVLKNSLSLCLAAQCPVALWWGRELIVIYNDAFARLLQLNVSESLGGNAENFWGTHQHDFVSTLQSVFASGKANQWQKLLPDGANSTDNELLVFFNSPVYLESGEVGGIFSIVTAKEKVVDHGTQRKLEESETRLRMAIESTNLGTWDYKPATGELYWSEKCREIYAIPFGQKIDFKTFSEHIYDEDRDFVQSQIANALDPVKGGSYNITYRITRFLSNEVRWIRTNGLVFFNAEKQPDRFIGAVVDITDEKEQSMLLHEKELRMRLALEASAMGTFDVVIGNSSFEYSRRFAEIFGFAPSDRVTQKAFVDRIHPNDIHLRTNAHEEAARSGVLMYEVRVTWPDGSIHWVRINGQITFDDQGKPKRLYGTAMDVTETRLHAEALEQKVKKRTRLLEEKNAELKRSEERYTRMTEEVQDYAIILLDRDGTILNWNKGAQSIKGYNEDEIIGKNFSLFYLEDDRQRRLPENLIRQAEEKGRAMHEGWRKRKDGTRFWGSVVITALHGENNNIIDFTKVTRDLTERKVAEDMMRQHASELEIKNKQLEQFAYIASHDLQEPLRKIQTFVQVLERKFNDPDVREKYIEKINASARRMGDLIQSVLNYSRLSKTEEYRSATDLSAILENVKVDYELLITEKHAVIENEPLPTIHAIPHQMSQLFSNLIGNSLKFSRGNPVISIFAKVVNGGDLAKNFPSAERSKKYLELVLKDNGIGFEQQYAEKIFTIFQRLNSRDEYAGTGIGLALCKRIVDNHNGFIEAQGSLGQGASFIIHLPLE